MSSALAVTVSLLVSAPGFVELTAEIEINPPVRVDADGREVNQAVAFGAGRHLVVWAAEDGIAGVRVNEDGTIADARAISISGDTRAADPAVAFDGTRWVVVWTANGDLKAARVAADGSVLDPNGVAIGASPGTATDPAVAANGAGRLLAVWIEGGEVRFARLETSPAIASLDGGGATVAAGPGTPQRPAVACDGTDCLVLWDAASGQSDVFGARVSAAGVVLDTPPRAIAAATANQQAPALAWDGTRYFAAWRDARGGVGVGFEVYGARIDRGGSPIDSSAIRIGEGDSDLSVSSHPSVIAKDGRFLVAWENRSAAGAPWDIEIASVDPTAGAVVAGSAHTIAADGDQIRPVLSSDAQGSLLVWEDRRAGEDFAATYGTRLDPSLSPLTPGGHRVSPVPERSSAGEWPELAHNGSGWLVAWIDDRLGMNAVHVARVDATGVSSSSVSALWPGMQNQSMPAVGCAGAYCLIAYRELVRVSLSRSEFHTFVVVVTPGGAPLGPPVDLGYSAAGGGRPSVAADGQHLMIASSGGGAIRLARFDPASRAISRAVSFAGAGAFNDTSWPSVARTRDAVIVTWEQQGFSGILVGAASPDLMTVDPAPRPVVERVNADFSAVASSGEAAFAVWSQGRQVLGRPISAGGVPLEAPAQVSSGTTTHQRPALVWNGASYVAGYTESRGGGGGFTGRVLAPDGRPIGGEIEIRSATGASADQIRAAAAPNGDVLFVYNASGRIRARKASFFCSVSSEGSACDDGDPCTVGDRCGSGLCTGARDPAPACAASDAGVRDSGATRDAGKSDAAVSVRDDGGRAPGGEQGPRDEGCGCGAARGRVTPLGAALIAWIALAASRRARRALRSGSG